MNIVQLSRFRSDVSKPNARRAERLLESDDLKKELEALTPLEVYFMIKERGVDDAAPLVRFATDEQLQAFVDLDCWTAERPDAVEMDVWLAPFAHESPDALAEAFLRLDEEVQVLYLQQSLTIFERDPENDPPDPPLHVTRKATIDGYYWVETKPGEEREVDPLLAVEALYAHDSNRAFSLLKAAIWELEGQLEESAYRFRSGRLADLGFPETSEAMAIFSAPPKQPRTPALPRLAEPVSLPAIYAQPMSDGSLLVKAMSRLADAQLLDRLERELVLLVNTAVVAYGDQPKDVRHAMEIAARVRDVVSVGLEHLLSPSAPHPFPDGEAIAAQAGDLLARWALIDLFRVGHALIMELAEVARRLLRDPLAQRWLDVEEPDGDYSQDRADRELVRALLAPRPLHGGFDMKSPGRRRAFANKRELVDAQARLDALGERVL